MQNAPGTIRLKDIQNRRKAQTSFNHAAPPAVRLSDKIYPLLQFVHGVGGDPPFPKVLQTRRWKVYAKSNVCVYCGIHGTHAVIWSDMNWVTGQEHMHHDMVHVDEKGNRLLMTLDHFIPKAKGGPDTIENLVVACSPCNNIKQDKIVVDFDPRVPKSNEASP